MRRENSEEGLFIVYNSEEGITVGTAIHELEVHIMFIGS